MSVMKALDPPEVIYTRDGKRRATHEAYSYHITPYQNPPVRLEAVKGFIDKSGQFLAITSTARTLEITPTEFRELISPTLQGKPAGDFRLSDVLGMIRKRGAMAAAAAAQPVAQAAPAADSAPDPKAQEQAKAPERAEPAEEAAPA